MQTREALLDPPPAARRAALTTHSKDVMTMTDPMPRRLLAVVVAGVLATVLAIEGAALAGQSGPAPRDDVVVEHPHRAEHETMMGRMRVDVPPAMVEQMRSEEMWRMMRDDRYIDRMEREQSGIDRMLGQNTDGPRR